MGGGEKGLSPAAEGGVGGGGRAGGGVEAGGAEGGIVVGERHPLGVEPGGNALDGAGPGVRAAGLGCLAALSDERLLQIFGALEPRELGRLACVSRAFCVMCNFEDIWRAHVVSDFRGKFSFQPAGWKRTYLEAKFPGRFPPALSPLSSPTSAILRRDAPFYSDLLYQPHFCARLDFPREWLEVENVERVAGPGLTHRCFEERFDKPNRPCILTGVVARWPACVKWDRAYLELAFAGETVHAGGYEFEPRDYFDYSEKNQDEQPLYLFDKEFARKAPGLLEDFSPPECFGEDLFAVLGEEERPDYRWLIAGPTRSGSFFHKDPNATSAWNAVISGSKKWVLFPPGTAPPGVHASADGADVATSVSLSEWFLNFYAEASEAEEPPLECIVRAGEAIFVPSGWWHLVMNLEDSIAVTQNFCSRGNLRKVERTLRSPHLVSGCPEEARLSLHARFLAALRRARPEIAAIFAPAASSAPAAPPLSALFASAGRSTGGFTFGFAAPAGAPEQPGGEGEQEDPPAPPKKPRNDD